MDKKSSAEICRGRTISMNDIEFKAASDAAAAQGLDLSKYLKALVAADIAARKGKRK